MNFKSLSARCELFLFRVFSSTSDTDICYTLITVYLSNCTQRGIVIGEVDLKESRFIQRAFLSRPGIKFKLLAFRRCIESAKFVLSSSSNKISNIMDFVSIR